jgi:hypothetical protein
MSDSIGIKKAMLEYIYAPALKRFNENMHLLARENAKIQGHTRYYFSYKGELYFNGDSTDFKPQMPYPRLADELREKANKLLQEVKKLHSERQYFAVFVSKAYYKTNSINEFKKLIPSMLHNIADEFSFIKDNREDLSHAQIEEFHQENKCVVDLLNKRLASHILEKL